MTTTLRSHGITVELPDGWDGRITNHGVPLERRSAAKAPAPSVESDGALAMPIVHLANFALPPKRGDYGSGAVESMGTNDVLIALLESTPDTVGTRLYESRGLPRRLHAGDFSTSALQRIIRGQMGWQHFFNDNGRAFVLYVVLGSRRRSVWLCREASEVLASTRIAPR